MLKKLCFLFLHKKKKKKNNQKKKKKKKKKPFIVGDLRSTHNICFSGEKKYSTENIRFYGGKRKVIHLGKGF